MSEFPTDDAAGQARLLFSDTPSRHPIARGRVAGLDDVVVLAQMLILRDPALSALEAVRKAAPALFPRDADAVTAIEHLRGLMEVVAHDRYAESLATVELRYPSSTAALLTHALRRAA